MSQPPERNAFLLGLKDSFGVPALELFAALSGYGVMARDAGFEFSYSILSVVTIWAMPMMMAFAELLAGHSPPWLVFVTLLAIGIRNLPMAVSAIPMIRDGPAFRWSHIVMAQLLSPTSWVQISVIGRTLPVKDRMPYYAAFSLMLLAGGLLGVSFGFAWAQLLPPVVGLSLLLLTPLFVLLTMAGAPKRSSKFALVAGSVMVPPLMAWDSEWGLILGGLGGGTLGYLLAVLLRRREARKP